MAIYIDGKEAADSRGDVKITFRAATVLLEANVLASHQASVAEGPVQEVRIVRPTVGEAVEELRRRWMQQADSSTYVTYGGYCRSVEHLTESEVEAVLDAVQEALEVSGKVSV